MYRLIAAWFGQAGLNPRPRLELNYSVAIKSLVTAGRGAAVPPLEHPKDAELNTGMQMRRPHPPLLRKLGLAHRTSELHDGAILGVLRTLEEFAGK